MCVCPPLVLVVRPPCHHERTCCNCAVDAIRSTSTGKSFFFYLSKYEDVEPKFLMFAQDRTGFGPINIMISMAANGAFFIAVYVGVRLLLLLLLL